MNIKSIGLGITVAAVATSISFTSAAQAATLAAGKFTVSGQNVSSVSGFSGAGDTNFVLNFDTKPLTIASTSGVFSGPTGLTGSANIASLNLTNTSVGIFNFLATSNFITGLKQNNEDIFFDLSAGSLTGFIASATNYSFGNTVTGILRDSSGNTVGANGGLASFIIGSGSGSNQSSITVETIPTPALLPGLIALGAGVLRKRKAEEAAESVA